MSTSRSISVALVDDSAPYRKMIGRYLSKHGFSILCEASNGHELFVQLDEFGMVPDVCIVDTSMPVMAGYDTAQQLNAKYPRVGVIGHSFFDKKKRQRMLESGAAECISKSQEPAVLAAAVQSLVQMQRA